MSSLMGQHVTYTRQVTADDWPDGSVVRVMPTMQHNMAICHIEHKVQPQAEISGMNFHTSDAERHFVISLKSKAFFVPGF